MLFLLSSETKEIYFTIRRYLGFSLPTIIQIGDFGIYSLNNTYQNPYFQMQLCGVILRILGYLSVSSVK